MSLLTRRTTRTTTTVQVMEPPATAGEPRPLVSCVVVVFVYIVRHMDLAISVHKAKWIMCVLLKPMIAVCLVYIWPWPRLLARRSRLFNANQSVCSFDVSCQLLLLPSSRGGYINGEIYGEFGFNKLYTNRWLA